MDDHSDNSSKFDIYSYTTDSPGPPVYDGQGQAFKPKKPKSSRKPKTEDAESSTKRRQQNPPKRQPPATESSPRHTISYMPVTEHTVEHEAAFRGLSYNSRISPSRLTSQVVSALPPEDSFASSKLHSALTGKLQAHPYLREAPQTSPVRIPSPARHPSPGSVQRSTPPMPSHYASPLGIKVPPDFNPSFLRMSPATSSLERMSPRAPNIPHNLPSLSPNLPSVSPRSEPSRSSPGPPRMSGPFIRPDVPVQPYRYIGDPSFLASVKTSAPNLRITATEPESVPRAPVPSSLQNLVLTMERQEQEARENLEHTGIPFSRKEYTTEHRLTEALLRQGVQDPSHLEQIYKGTLHPSYSPYSVTRASSPPIQKVYPSAPERISPVPHPKKDLQRRATPPPRQRTPPFQPTTQEGTHVSQEYTVDVSKLPFKHRAKRLDQQSIHYPHAVQQPSAPQIHHHVSQSIPTHLQQLPTQTQQHVLSHSSPSRSQLSAIIAQPMVSQIHMGYTPQSSMHQSQAPPNVTVPVNIPTMLLHNQPLLNLPRMPIEAHGGVIRIPENKLDSKTQEIISRNINLPTDLQEQIKKEIHPASLPKETESAMNINPFTFPKGGVKISTNISTFLTDRNESNTPPTATYPRSRSDISFLRRKDDVSQIGDMPHLVPEETEKLMQTTDKKFGDYQEIAEESKKLKPWVGQFNMRIKNLANFPVSTSTYRSAYRTQSVAVQRAKACSITGAAKSLDLLRQTLQKSMNKEIDAVIQKYIEKFFNMGIANIKENTGPTAVTDEHMNSVCRQILEEAKKMYVVERRRSVSPCRDYPDNLSDTGSSSGKRNPLKKRRYSDSDSEKGSDHSNTKRSKKKGRPFVSGRSTPSKIKASDLVRRDGQKWDPDRLNLDTLFVMGARANKALGLGNTRGRLYIKHPEVFKYSGDQDDKQWLYEHHLMPATGGKAYMLLVEDIKDLAETDEYRDGPLLMNELTGFAVPEWMISKMKSQMNSMRTDRGKVHSRSATPSEASLSSLKELDGEDSKTLPFSGFSDSPLTISKTENETTSIDAEMEFLSGADISGSNMSPFNLTGGFDDTTSPSPSDIDNLDDDPSYTTPFGLSKS